MNNEIEREFIYISQNVFKVKTDHRLANLYVEAINAGVIAGDYKRVTIKKLIEKKLDYNSVEFYLRCLGKKNELTLKAHLVLYLLESSGMVLKEGKEEISPAYFILCIFKALLISCFSFVKGAIISKFYRLENFRSGLKHNEVI